MRISYSNIPLLSRPFQIWPIARGGGRGFARGVLSENPLLSVKGFEGALMRSDRKARLENTTFGFL